MNQLLAEAPNDELSALVCSAGKARMWNRVPLSALVAGSVRDGVMSVVRDLCSSLGYAPGLRLEERADGGWQLALADPSGDEVLVPVADDDGFAWPLTLVDRAQKHLPPSADVPWVAGPSERSLRADLDRYVRDALSLGAEETAKVLLTLRLLGLRALDVSVFRRMVVQYACLHLAGQFEAWFKWTTLMYWFSCMSVGRVEYKNVSSEPGGLLLSSVKPKRPEGLTAFIAGAIGPGNVYRFLTDCRRQCRVRGSLRDWSVPDTIKQMKDQCAPVTARLRDAALREHRRVLTQPVQHSELDRIRLRLVALSCEAVVDSIYPRESLGMGPHTYQRATATTQVLVQTPSCSASFEKGRSEGGAVSSIMTRLDTLLPSPATEPTRCAGGDMMPSPYVSHELRHGADWVPDERERDDDASHSSGSDLSDPLTLLPASAESARLAVSAAVLDWRIRRMRKGGPPRRIKCTPLVVADPCKARPITKGESIPYWLALHLQRCLHGNLRRHPNFVLTGTMLDPEIVERVVLPGHSYGQHLFSADFKSATDLLDPWVSRRIAHLISDRLGLHRVMREIFDASLVGHEIHWDALYGGTGIQMRGQLMGSPTSFPVLCIANAACIHAAYSLHLEEILDAENGGLHYSCGCMKFLGRFVRTENGRRVPCPIPLMSKGRPVLPFLVNGDDALSTGCMGFYAHLTSFYSAAGLQLSPGKNIVSDVFAEMNSVRMIVHHDDRPGPFLEHGHGYRATPVPCVMSGIAFTPTRDDRLDPLAEIESLADVAWQLIDRGWPEWREDLLATFVAGRPELLHPALRRIPWWGPKCLGCLGLPPFPRRGRLAWSPEQLKWMAYFRGLSTGRLEEEWRNVWRRGKTISAPVHDFVSRHLKGIDGYWVDIAENDWEQPEAPSDAQYAAIAQAAVFGHRLLPSDRSVDVSARGQAITSFVDKTWRKAQRVPDHMSDWSSIQRALHARRAPRKWVYDSSELTPVYLDLRDLAVLNSGSIVLPPESNFGYGRAADAPLAGFSKPSWLRDDEPFFQFPEVANP